MKSSLVIAFLSTAFAVACGHSYAGLLKCDFTNSNVTNAIGHCMPDFTNFTYPLIINRGQMCTYMNVYFDCFEQAGCLEKEGVEFLKDHLNAIGLACHDGNRASEIVLSLFGHSECKMPNDTTDFNKCVQSEMGQDITNIDLQLKNMCKLQKAGLTCLKQENCITVDPAVERLQFDLMNTFGIPCENVVENATCNFRDPNLISQLQRCSSGSQPQFVGPTDITKRKACELNDESLLCYAQIGCIGLEKISQVKETLAYNGFDCSEAGRTSEVVAQILTGSECRIMTDTSESMKYTECITDGLRKFNGTENPDLILENACSFTRSAYKCLKERDCLTISKSYEDSTYILLAALGFKC